MRSGRAIIQSASVWQIIGRVGPAVQLPRVKQTFTIPLAEFLALTRPNFSDPLPGFSLLVPGKKSIRIKHGWKQLCHANSELFLASLWTTH